ncbi:hypothetical protein [Paenibacillus sp. H1-7]|uniref:hypothetical protein n=1 Tax=Paenibacillus sp. H1-7 TaxID=2282849 RepID=UPI001EF84DBA|nr:hypothetical protein [Paenibacillus sp. H1-7]
MEDGYDFASAIKDVDRQMPAAAYQIRKYIDRLKRQINQPATTDENRETENSNS